MIDPDLKYCPKCNDEYRAEIVKCGVCDAELITGRQKIEMEEMRRKKLESRMKELSPDDDLVRLRRGTLAEMRHLANLLYRERIETLLMGDMSTCGKDRFGNTVNTPTAYDILVRREDGREAIHIIEEEHRKTTSLEHHDRINADTVFNPDAGMASCPACGCNFQTTETTCPDCGLSFG